jgi:hypothetical protein
MLRTPNGVANMYLQMKEEYSEIGFVLDLEESEDPKHTLRELPDESEKK